MSESLIVETIPVHRLSRRRFLATTTAVGGSLALGAACAPASQPSPTAPPAAKPTTAPPAAASPASKPAAAPATSVASPGASPSSVAFGPIPKVNTSTKVAVSHLNSILSNAQFAIGRARGFWDEWGLTQEFVEYAGGGDSVRGVTSGANQYGQVAPTATIAAFVKGEKVRLIGTSYGALTIKFLVPKDSPLQTIKDVEGKKVGFSTPGSNSHFLAQESLQQAGVKAEVVAVGGAAESLTALKTGIVQASWAAEPVPALNQADFRVLWDTNTYVPNFSETVLITTADYADKNGDVLRAALAGYDKGNTFIKQSPAEAARVWAQDVGLGDKADLVVKAFQDAPTQGWTLKLDRKALDAIEKSMRDLKQIDAAVNWKELIDQRFLPEGLRIDV